jgi:hypothetical protein
MLALSTPHLLSGAGSALRRAARLTPNKSISIRTAPDFPGRAPSSERE